MELNLDADLNIHWPAIFQGRLELPLLDRLKCLFVEAKSKTAYHTYVSWAPSRIYDEPQYAGTLFLGSPRFFRVIGIRRRDRRRSRYSSPNLVDAAAHTAAATSPYSRAVSNSYASARTGADASSGTGTVRWRRSRHRGRIRHSESRHVVVGKMHL